MLGASGIAAVWPALPPPAAAPLPEESHGPVRHRPVGPRPGRVRRHVRPVRRRLTRARAGRRRRAGRPQRLDHGGGGAHRFRGLGLRPLGRRDRGTSPGDLRDGADVPGRVPSGPTPDRKADRFGRSPARARVRPPRPRHPRPPGASAGRDAAATARRGHGLRYAPRGVWTRCARCAPEMEARGRIVRNRPARGSGPGGGPQAAARPPMPASSIAGTRPRARSPRGAGWAAMMPCTSWMGRGSLKR